MSTGPVPPLIPSVETGTPPREWSESVLASGPTKDTPAVLSEIPSREGDPKVAEERAPEEFLAPKELRKSQTSSRQELSPTATRDQPSIGVASAQTARQYVPEQGIKDTVASYLSSEKATEGPHVSLPSTELKGAQPSEHTGGVGALPGNLSESSVALLPDERQESAQERFPTSLRQRRDTMKPSVAGEGDETQPRESQKQEASVAQNAAPSKGPVAYQQSDIPLSSTQAGAAEAVEGNTAASGSEVESRRKGCVTKSQEASSKQEETGADSAVGIVGTAPSAEKPNEKMETERNIQGSNPALEEIGQGKGPSQDIQEEATEGGRIRPARKVEAGYGEGYHPAQLHPPPPGASVADCQSSVSAQKQGQDLSAAGTGKEESGGIEKKPGFMTLVKGEMKILAGKVSGDEHKVQEGKKLVHGEA